MSRYAFDDQPLPIGRYGFTCHAHPVCVRTDDVIEVMALLDDHHHCSYVLSNSGVSS